MGEVSRKVIFVNSTVTQELAGSLLIEFIQITTNNSFIALKSTFTNNSLIDLFMFLKAFSRNTLIQKTEKMTCVQVGMMLRWLVLLVNLRFFLCHYQLKNDP